MAKIELVKHVKYAGDIHKKLVELGWDLDTAALFCDDLPDADVAPVRHGHWIDCEDDYSSYVRCSVCGDEFTCWEADCAHTDFCPGCGADMRDGGADNA